MTYRSEIGRRSYLRAAGAGISVATMGVGSAAATGDNGQVVFIYDDSAKTDYSVAFPVHQDEGVPACSAAIAASVIPDRPDSMFIGPSKLNEMDDAGWEIMSHSLFHRYLGEQQITHDIAPDDTRIYLPSKIFGNLKNFKIRISDGANKTIAVTVGAGADENGTYVKLKDAIGEAYSVADGTTVRYPDNQIKDTLSRSKTMLKKKGISNVSNFVYPYGAHESYIVSILPDYFDGVGNFYDGSGLNPRNGFDPYRTNRREFSRNSMSNSDLKTYFDKVANSNKLGVLGGHTYYDSFDADRIRTAIQMAKDRNIEIVTLRQAIADNTHSSTSTSSPTSTSTSPSTTPTPTPTATTSTSSATSSSASTSPTSRITTTSTSPSTTPTSTNSSGQTSSNASTPTTTSSNHGGNDLFGTIIQFIRSIMNLF